MINNATNSETSDSIEKIIISELLLNKTVIAKYKITTSILGHQTPIQILI